MCVDVHRGRLAGKEVPYACEGMQDPLRCPSCISSEVVVSARTVFIKTCLGMDYILDILVYCTPVYFVLSYSTLLYSTLLYSTLLYSTLLYSTLLYSTLLYSTLSTLLYPTDQLCCFADILVYTNIYISCYVTFYYIVLQLLQPGSWEPR